MRHTNWKRKFQQCEDALKEANKRETVLINNLTMVRADRDNYFARIKELTATVTATQNSVDERIRLATTDKDREIFRLTERVNSDAAFIEHKRVELLNERYASSAYRSLIIDALHGRGGAVINRPDGSD